MATPNDPVSSVPAASRPRPSTAQEIREAGHWDFSPGNGLVIACRHLPFDELLLTGQMPLPALEAFSKFEQVALSDVLKNPESYVHLLAAASRYAELAAIAPRISATPTDDPDVLVLGKDFTYSSALELMNIGTRRRLEVRRQVVDMFRRTEPPAVVPDRADGDPLPDATELLADAPDGSK